MHLSTRVLGKSIADQIAARASTPLLEIGSDKLYRRDLATVSCFNFTAASNLNRLIASLQIRNIRELFDRVPPVALVMPHLGAISLAVLGAAFEVKGVGGDAPLESWFAKHSAREDHDFSSFNTLKHAEALREIGEKKARQRERRRKHTRRDQAQRLRGNRFIERKERVNNVTE